MTDLAKAMKEDCEFEDVGIRPGEKIHEVMVTEEDSRTTYEYDDHYIIYPDFDWWKNLNIKTGGKKLKTGSDILQIIIKNGFLLMKLGICLGK